MISLRVELELATLRRMPRARKPARVTQPSEDLEDILGRLTALESTVRQLWDGQAIDAPRIEGLEAVGQELRKELERMVTWRNEITAAVAEGITRVDRSERRVKASIKRARRQLADLGLVDDGLEAEAGELLEGDEQPSRAREVPPVQPPVEDPDETPSSIPGVTLGQLRRARGW